MTFTVAREFWFAAAHRLEGHPKCGRLHGHNYKVQVSIQSDVTLDGMVMDFADLDRAVKPIIEELDHRYIVSDSNIASDDPYAYTADVAGHAVRLPMQASTAECIAAWIHGEVCGWFREIGLDRYCTGMVVSVWETPKSVATYQE